jgi:hypothetical protein
MAATDPIAEPTPEPEGQDAPEAPVEAASEKGDVAHDTAGCPVTWCPICITVGAVQPIAPDVMEHLLKAGTELFLAFRAVVDARADETENGTPAETTTGSTTLEKIDLG